MNKDQLIQVFKFQNLFLGVVVTIVAIGLLLFGEGPYIVGLSIGMVVGLWIGVLINHFIKIPKSLGNKDERELIILVVGNLIGSGSGYVTLVLALSFTFTGLIELTQLNYLICVFLSAFIIILTSIGTNQVLRRIF